MLASLADAPLADPDLVYEPKYDGIRAIAEIDARGRVRLWSRLGNEKTNQFPEVAEALERWARRRKAAAGELILDGEIVALDAQGEPAGFQQLQGRIHLTDGKAVAGANTAFIAFDILREGRRDLRGRTWLDRRAILERVLNGWGSESGTTSGLLRISETARGDGRALYERALARGWEGVIAKSATSIYQSGRRTPDWRKLKIVREQEFVVGGWTEPRHTRSYFGALLLGVYDYDNRKDRGERRQNSSSASSAPSAVPVLVYVGHTGTGFNERELARLMKLLKALETDVCPFAPRPPTNERAHWVRPTLVAQIKFTEWTADGKLRHPVYLGLRDDKKPEEVVREPTVRLHAASKGRLEPAGAQAPLKPDTTKVRLKPETTKVRLKPDTTSNVLQQLRELEDSRRDGVLHLPDGGRLNVTNLHKMFWPKQKFTKGDLFRYYVEAADYVLPAVADRPLVMKRYPNGVTAKPFYQHRVEDVPPGVRVEIVEAAEKRRHLVGGSLATLMYLTQLAAISQDPWFSRVQSIEYADHVAIDLDPSSGVKFDRVLEVARAVRDELQTLGALGVPKTSGSDGLHIYVPLPAGTPYDAGLLFCQIIATVVAHKHPKIATVERSVSARGARVYVDYLQNVLGKTLATAYSARASAYAGVSTPLTWQEIDEGVRREDFTIKSIPARLAQVGDLWAALRKSKGVDLSKVSRYARGTRRVR